MVVPPHPVPPAWLATVGTGLADLVLGSRCAGCAQAAVVWCDRCEQAAGEPRLAGMVAGGVPVVAAGRYDGPLGRAVVGHKERGRLALARPLGGLLAGAVLATRTPAPAVLVPVPSAPHAVRARGQDHAMRLAVAAARELRVCGHDFRAVAALRVTRAVADQAGLSAAARRVNLAGAFAVRRRAAGDITASAVVVVDDVMTTGSSLGAAVDAVRCAGARVAACAVVAVASPRCG